jgi:hypothetical protein
MINDEDDTQREAGIAVLIYTSQLQADPLRYSPLLATCSARPPVRSEGAWGPFRSIQVQNRQRVSSRSAFSQEPIFRAFRVEKRVHDCKRISAHVHIWWYPC